MSDVSIVISTSNARVFNIAIPTPRARVRYVVVHEVFGDSAPHKVSELSWRSRDDVIYLNLPFPGLSKSRNAGLAACKTTYAYIMDDDVAFDLDMILQLIDWMDADKVSVAAAQTTLPDGTPRKTYASAPHELKLLETAGVSSCEVCVNADEVRKNAIKFDERFGLGTELPSGEEFIFLADCLRHGLKVKYYPIITTIHPEESSGVDFFTTDAKIAAKREMCMRIFGKAGMLFVVLFWIKKMPNVWRAGHALHFTRVMLLGACRRHPS